jgi:hypothetical protein
MLATKLAFAALRSLSTYRDQAIPIAHDLVIPVAKTVMPGAWPDITDLKEHFDEPTEKPRKQVDCCILWTWLLREMTFAMRTSLTTF